MEMDDMKRRQAEMNAVIYGRNKKRGRSEAFADDFGNEDDF